MALKLTLFLFNRATYARMKAFIGHTLAHDEVYLTLALSSSLLWNEFGKPVSYIEKWHPKARFAKLSTAMPPFTEHGMALAQAQIAEAVAEHVSKDRPDVAMVVADRYETDPTSMVLSSFRIPTIHVQGGEVSGNIDEKVRHAVTKRSDYHFAATELSAKYIVQMGEDEERVFHTGCPSIDLIRTNKIGRGETGKHVLCVFHPETESIDDAFEQTRVVMDAVTQFCARNESHCEWFYPNPDPGRKKITDYLDQEIKKSDTIARAINREPEEFLTRLASSALIIGNSSCLIRECAYLGVPAVLVGDRQAIRERGANVMEVEYEASTILQAMEYQKHKSYPRNAKLFGFGKARQAMLDIILDIHRRDGFSVKGPLTYPAWKQFREEHFGTEATTTAGARKTHNSKENNEAIHPGAELLALSG